MKITKCTHVTATERRHLKAFIASGHTQAKVNRKTYVITKGTQIKGGYEYEIKILTPYKRESTGQMENGVQTITHV